MAFPHPNEGRFLLSVPYAAHGTVTYMEVTGIRGHDHQMESLTTAVSSLSINESLSSYVFIHLQSIEHYVTSLMSDDRDEYTELPCVISLRPG